jgi:glucose/arabinose dehydrogenase
VPAAGGAARVMPMARRPLPYLALLLVALAGGAIALVATRAAEQALEATVVQSGLEIPWDLDFTPDGRMVVTERPGRIRVYASPDPRAPLLQTVEVANVRAEGEAGLMGIAVDVDFPDEPFVYVCASLDEDRDEGESPWHNALLRFRFEDSGDGRLVTDGVLFDEPMVAAVHHNGCAVEMDRERHLWFTMGDGNVSVLEVNPAQDPTSLNGKVLRIRADGSIPPDNPVLPGADGPSAAWSLGHRNAQGLAFAPDGSLYVTEHGTDADDEINRIAPGGNYGYGCWTDVSNPGPAQEGPAAEGCGGASDYLPATWASGTPTIAPSGARFVVGEAWGAMSGSLLVATLREQDLRRFELRDDGQRLEQVEVLFDQQLGRLRAVVLGPDGALFLTTSDGVGDRVLRVEPPAAPGLGLSWRTPH